MTTIAYRAGVLAADTQVTNHDVVVGSCVKVFLRADGHMAAGTGGFSYIQKFIAWFMGGEAGDAPLPRRDDDTDEGGGYIFRPDDTVISYESGGPNTLICPYYAEGSGRRFALGAMAAGLGPEDAVRAAIAHDIYSGGEVTVLKRADG